MMFKIHILTLLFMDRFLSKYMKEALICVMCDYRPSLLNDMLQDRSLRDWIHAKEVVVRSLHVSYTLLDKDGDVVSSKTQEKQAFFGTYLF